MSQIEESEITDADLEAADKLVRKSRDFRAILKKKPALTRELQKELVEIVLDISNLKKNVRVEFFEDEGYWLWNRLYHTYYYCRYSDKGFSGYVAFAMDFILRSFDFELKREHASYESFPNKK